MELFSEGISAKVCDLAFYLSMGLGFQEGHKQYVVSDEIRLDFLPFSCDESDRRHWCFQNLAFPVLMLSLLEISKTKIEAY